MPSKRLDVEAVKFRVADGYVEDGPDLERAMFDDLAALISEVERLQAALTEIVEGGDARSIFAVGIAARALGVEDAK